MWYNVYSYNDIPSAFKEAVIMIRRGLLIWANTVLLTGFMVVAMGGSISGFVGPAAIIFSTMMIAVLTVTFIKMISEELKRRKRFVIINTSLYAVGMLLVFLLSIAAEYESGWDGLVYDILAVFLFVGAFVGSLIAWIGNSIYWNIRIKKEAMQ